MKNIIIVTGGAGFVGSNLISLLIKKISLSAAKLLKFALLLANRKLCSDLYLSSNIMHPLFLSLYVFT